MKTTTMLAVFAVLTALCSGALTAADDNVLALKLPGHALTVGRINLRRGDDGSMFLLDRSLSVLYRIDPASGKPLWQIDGSESGNEFIDPAWLSRPDGFYVFLTDRGSRRVWRVDYRGELRGAVELAFATDPVLLEIAAGGQLLVHDRAAGLIYLLDDSGRMLWSFPPGEGRVSAEPVRLAVGPAGARVYLLWRDTPQLSVIGLAGQSTWKVEIDGGLPGEVIAMAAAGSDDNTELCLITADGLLFKLDPRSGELKKIELGGLSPLDICGDSRGFTVLTGPEPTLRRLELEGGR